MVIPAAVIAPVRNWLAIVSGAQAVVGVCFLLYIIVFFKRKYVNNTN